MNITDLLRQLADKLDGIEQGGEHAEVHQAQLEPVDAISTEQPDQITMVPPLQAKLELLKKATGVDNHYDGQGEELDDIKKLTGIQAVISHEAGEDNDIVG
jgi:hypothetical protein